MPPTMPWGRGCARDGRERGHYFWKPSGHTHLAIAAGNWWKQLPLTIDSRTGLPCVRSTRGPRQRAGGTRPSADDDQGANIFSRPPAPYCGGKPMWRWPPLMTLTLPSPRFPAIRRSSPDRRTAVGSSTLTCAHEKAGDLAILDTWGSPLMRAPARWRD